MISNFGRLVEMEVLYSNFIQLFFFNTMIKRLTTTSFDEEMNHFERLSESLGLLKPFWRPFS